MPVSAYISNSLAQSAPWQHAAHENAGPFFNGCPTSPLSSDSLFNSPLHPCVYSVPPPAVRRAELVCARLFPPPMRTPCAASTPGAFGLEHGRECGPVHPGCPPPFYSLPACFSYRVWPALHAPSSMLRARAPVLLLGALITDPAFCRCDYFTAHMPL